MGLQTEMLLFYCNRFPADTFPGGKHIMLMAASSLFVLSRFLQWRIYIKLCYSRRCHWCCVDLISLGGGEYFQYWHRI